MPTSHEKLRESFRRIFPEEVKRLDACKNEKEFDEVHEAIIAEAERKVEEAIHKVRTECSTEEHQALFGACFAAMTEAGPTTGSCRDSGFRLTYEQYKIIIAATGQDIEQQIQVLIQGLHELQDMTSNDPALAAAKMIANGILAIGHVPCNTVAVALLEGLTTREAVLVGLTATVASLSWTAVLAISALIILSLSVPLYFMQKPATCFCLLINELDAPLLFLRDFCVHGARALVTSPISHAVDLGNGKISPCAGFVVARKNENAFVGSQYGLAVRYKGEDLAFGMENPLLFGSNRCYCEFTSDAAAVAYKTDDKGALSWQESNGELCLSIKCHSGSGNVAFFVVRAYKSGN